jgi:hypothetical protein
VRKTQLEPPQDPTFGGDLQRWHDHRLVPVAITCALFAAVNGWAAFRHVMWRDEWMPLNAARFSPSIGEWFNEIKYIGRWGFFGAVWIIEQCGGHPWLFKLCIVSVSTLGVYIVCRHAPFTWPQKALLSFGYYPLYEYGTILRDYSVIWAATVGCCALLASPRWRPLAFGAALALLFQTNPFGLGLACVLGSTYAFDMWRAGRLNTSILTQPAVWGGGLLAIVSFAIAFKTMTPPPEIAEIVLGQPLRTDSHVTRLFESLPFPLRAWLPIPLFGTWNSHILDPWPWLQIALGATVAAVVISVLRTEATALFLFVIGMLGLGAILCHVPWTALRYHGPYFLLIVCAYWVMESRLDKATSTATWPPVFRWTFDRRRPLFTGLLLIHSIVAMEFIVQEQVVPFSGSKEAAHIILQNEPPDVLVVGDPDYAMISLAGYLDRPVWIASRQEPGAFTKVDKRRRGTPLGPEELGAAVSERLAAEKRDVVLVTNYPVAMPAEIGMPLGATKSITDERYFIYRMRYRRSPSE